MKLAVEAAKEADIKIPLGEVTEFLYKEGLAHEGGRLKRKDFSVMYQFLKELNQV
jgi:3-hydroxyisobutyrate dehydrogenase